MEIYLGGILENVDYPDGIFESLDASAQFLFGGRERTPNGLVKNIEAVGDISLLYRPIGSILPAVGILLEVVRYVPCATSAYKVYGGVFALLVCVFLLLAGCSPQWRANGNAAGAPATFLYIAAGAALCTGLDILVSLLSGAPADTRITANIPLAIITLALLPAAAEELLFRGFILHSLRQYGDVFAVIISSV